MIVVFDIDGTIADLSHREHFIEEKGKEDWDSFFSEAQLLEDKPIKSSVDGFNAFVELSDKSFIISARPKRTLDVTEEWLLGNGFNIDNVFGNIILRPDNLQVRSHEFKETVFKEFILNKNIDDFFIFIDDQENNLEMFSKYGVALKAPEIWSIIR
jgi:hypothetical protein